METKNETNNVNKYNFAKNPSSVILCAEFIAHCFKKPRAKQKAAG